jgi:hypothetical protein
MWQGTFVIEDVAEIAAVDPAAAAGATDEMLGLVPSAARRADGRNKCLLASSSRWQLVDERGPFVLDHDAHFVRDNLDRLYFRRGIHEVAAGRRASWAIDGVGLDRLFRLRSLLPFVLGLLVHLDGFFRTKQARSPPRALSEVVHY